MTTFNGHFNIFGVTQFVDYRVIPGGLDLNAVLSDVRSKGGIASINHAEAPGGEACMGCKWKAPSTLDMSLFSAVEVINGGQIMLSSAKFWDSELQKGHPLAAIGGSDSHNATNPPGPPGSIGWPTTAVEADELTVPAILRGIRAGRTFVDLTASRDKAVDFKAQSGEASVQMGGTLHALAGAPVHVMISTVACTGSVVHLLLDGEEVPIALPVPSGDSSSTVETTVKAAAGRHWLRVEVRKPDGTLLLVSSPLYLN